MRADLAEGRPTLQGARVRLEPVRLDVAQALLAGTDPGLPTAADYPHADTADALGPAVLGGEAPTIWFVVRRSDDALIGDCGLRPGPQPGDAELGYGLAPSARGQGLGADAVATLVRHACSLPGTARVVAETMSDNLASRRILERLGFTVVDVIGPMVWYGLVLADAARDRRRPTWDDGSTPPRS